MAQYIIRNPFSEAKLTYREDTGMVVYKSKMTLGKDKRSFLVVNAEEFIALITQLYLGLWEEKTRPPSSSDISPDKVSTYEPFDDGRRPGYEEPCITVD